LENQENSESARRTRIRSFGFIVSLIALVGHLTGSCRAQGKTTQVAQEASGAGLIGFLVVVGIIAMIGQLFRNKRERQLLLSGKRPIVVKRYVGTQSGSYASFQRDAVEMASLNYFPTSQSWMPGQWGAGAFIIALLLCLILIGIIVFVYMLVAKPNGTLSVTYERRAPSVKEKTCPNCAEQIKAAALACRFCGYEFERENADEAIQRPFSEGQSLEPPRKRNIKAIVGFFIVSGIAIAAAAIGISNGSIRSNSPVKELTSQQAIPAAQTREPITKANSQQSGTDTVGAKERMQSAFDDQAFKKPNGMSVGGAVASRVDQPAATSKSESAATIPGIKPSAAIVADPTSMPRLSSVRMTEAYEGLWVQTKKDCLDDDGPNSRTLIDLGNVVDGKLTPIFDQYENHCRIEEKTKSGNVTTLTLTCYEFWQYLSENKEGSPAAIVISLEQKGRIRIDGKSYQLCKPIAALNAKR
jgi:hypothetical protein